MSKSEAIAEAKKRVAENGTMQYVIRRGDRYDVSPHPFRAFWKIFEVIGPGNIHNF